ncbi:MAG TPA: chorismate synthase [Luteibaculaceae bacterium]|nr:chorismate synthase [Luteibaculaceae bacterium]
MNANSFGRLFTVTTFGESHGVGLGVVIDGCPAGVSIDMSEIQRDLNRRKPGQSKLTTQRQEADEVRVLSGIYEGRTTGTPIALVLENNNQRSQDYDHLQGAYRPSHADFTYDQKYGHVDFRGGGRSSARETAARVAAGSIAKQWLKQHGISFSTYVSQVKDITASEPSTPPSWEQIEANPVRCPDPQAAEQMIDLIEKTRKNGDSVGGVIKCHILQVPVGLGEPVFDKLHARLAYAMMGINAVKGFSLGSGFHGTRMLGSEHNDVFYRDADGQTRTKTNHSGGIQGGISNGEPIAFEVAFKPVATIMQNQETIDRNGESVTIAGKGRHDPCVLPRAVAIVEAMAALVIADFMLLRRRDRAF